jgi:ATP/maltotriose-dependent transcriptional regulator MalT
MERRYLPGLPRSKYDPIEQGFGLTVEALSRQGVETRNAIRCRALFAASELAAHTGRLSESIAFLDESMAIARERQDNKRLLGGLRVQAYRMARMGNHKVADALAAEALSLSEALGEDAAIAFTLRWLGEMALVRGDLEAAESYALRGLKLARSSDDPVILLGSLLGLAKTALARGETATAVHRAAELLSIDAVKADARWGAGALHLAASLAVLKEEWRLAARFYGAVDALPSAPDTLPPTALSLLDETNRQAVLSALGERELASERDFGANCRLGPAIDQAREWLLSVPQSPA